MEKIAEYLGRHGEKVLFGVVTALSLGFTVHRAMPDPDLDRLARDHASAVSAIEACVVRAQQEAPGDAREVPAVSEAVETGYVPCGPDADLGPLAGLAVYLPTPTEDPVDDPVAVRPAPPVRIEGLRIASSSPQRLDLEWNPVPGADAYVVRRAGGDEREWRVTEPRLSDDAVAGAETYRYAVQAIDETESWGDVAGEVGSPLEATIPESAAVEFRSYQPSTGLATFRVRHHRGGVWYERTFYDVRVGDRIGQALAPGGRPKNLAVTAEAGSGTLQLDTTTPWIFAGAQAEEVPVLLPRKEYLIRHGAGDADTTWAPSLAEFKAAHPELAAEARMEEGASGGFASRVVDVPVLVDGRPSTRTKYRAVLQDVRKQGDEARRLVGQID